MPRWPSRWLACCSRGLRHSASYGRRDWLSRSA
jgi:hypothetical protein